MARPPSPLALTWWGHSTVTLEHDGVRVLTDPVLADRIVHLRRHGPTPGPEAARADLVLVSHLHGDHLHVPSLRGLGPATTLVVPRGGAALARGLAVRSVLEASPGDVLDVAGLWVQVAAAHHDGRRLPGSRHRGPALGFRVAGPTWSWWYPGDTGVDQAHADVEPVDLALVPIGGWGPTLGHEHLDPDQAADAVRSVGTRWALPVHHATFWPLGLRRVHRANHYRLFVTPGPRFAEAVARVDPGVEVLLPRHGERVVLPARAPSSGGTR